jgi:hypothetical protein
MDRNGFKRLVKKSKYYYINAFAKSIGVEPNTFNSYLYKKNKIPTGVFLRVCKELNVETDDLKDVFLID